MRIFHFFYKKIIDRMFKYIPSFLSLDYSVLQFIAFPFLFVSYKNYLHNHLNNNDENDKNDNIICCVSHNNKKILSKTEYVDRYKVKVEELYRKYRSSISNQLSNQLIQPELELELEIQLECTDFTHLNNAYIIEYTPKGNVIMTYNHTDKTIEYFCDNSLSNDIIRTVFQKFTMQFKCFPLYFGYIETKCIDNHIKNDKNDKNDKNKISKFMQNKNPNVFASFKKYNNNNKDGIVGAASAAGAAGTASAVGKDKPIKPNEHTLTDFCTIRNSGKFYNFTFLTSNNNKGNNHKGKNIKNVSFSQFKNKGNHCVT